MYFNKTKTRKRAKSGGRKSEREKREERERRERGKEEKWENSPDFLTGAFLLSAQRRYRTISPT